MRSAKPRRSRARKRTERRASRVRKRKRRPDLSERREVASEFPRITKRWLRLDAFSFYAGLEVSRPQEALLGGLFLRALARIVFRRFAQHVAAAPDGMDVV